MKKLLISLLLVLVASCTTQIKENQLPLTHGPLLGGVTSNSIKVWSRTATPDQFYVRYGKSKDQLNVKSSLTTTRLENDNTGTVTLENLEAGTQYYFALFADGKQLSQGGSFKTLQDRKILKSKHNQKGLFNFSFEFACGNNQNPRGSI